jgi:hypothetical protein
VSGFRSPLKRNARFLVRRAALFLAAFGLAACFTPTFGQGLAREDGSVPVPMDWSSKHVLFTPGSTKKQAAKILNEPRAYAQWVRHRGASTSLHLKRRHPTPPRWGWSRDEIGRDWAVPLGAGGVAQGMAPAKYSFDVTAAPSCTSDYAVFPINTSTGNTRAHVAGTFVIEPAAGGTTAITITPAGRIPVTLTLTASASSNTGLNFQVSPTVATNATNLAAAINRNLSSVALDRIVAVALGNTVTVYALTPGNRVTLTDASSLIPPFSFSWGGVTAGTNGSQANIVAFNELYSGPAPGLSLCQRTNPEFIFSYASGVGPVATSPTLSLDGTEIAYVENDPNIGAIFHVLTFGSGSTEYGTAASCVNNNNGAVNLPTCATSPVIPGSTAGSTATDFMLPLGLVAANAATAIAGAADSFSSPFVSYYADVTYVGDNNGYLYAIAPTFSGTPDYAGGNFPVQVSATPASTAPTSVKATTTVVTVTVPNSLAIGELVTVAGVAANGTHCSAADAVAINGTHIVNAGVTGTQFQFSATIPTATNGTGCTVTGATVTPGSNYLSAPVADVGGTGNIFVGDSSANLYELTPAGATAATALSLGAGFGTVNGGIRDSPIIDSTNAVGYLTLACSGNTTGAFHLPPNAGLVQFGFTGGTTLTKIANVGVDHAATQNCSAAGYPMYAPAPDERYYDLGIGSPTEADNGEIIEVNSGSGGLQINTWGFTSSAMNTTALAGQQPLTPNPTVVSPLTEFFNSEVFAVTGVTATTTTVTVIAINTLAANDLVTMSGVALNAANGCTAADVAAINGGLYTVVSATGAQFTFNATIPNATTGCTVTGATATGGPDYMFVGSNSYQEILSYLLPAGAESGTSATLPNTTDAVGGTSDIIVDNESTSGQASSLYFGTLATSTTLCGTTAAYCAVKLTQAGLQ